MHEWRRFVRERLGNLGLSPEREAEIVEELAQYLESRFRESVAKGLSDKEALDEAPMMIIARPAGIITARIVPESGLVAPAGYDGAIFELFREGHVPETQSEDSGLSMDPGGFDYLDDESEIIF